MTDIDDKVKTIVGIVKPKFESCGVISDGLDEVLAVVVKGALVRSFGLCEGFSAEYSMIRNDITIQNGGITEIIDLKMLDDEQV